MTRPAPHPDSLRATFETIAEMTATASNYAALASDFATLNDPRGLAYATRCATAALLEASSLVEEVRPPGSAKTGRAA